MEDTATPYVNATGSPTDVHSFSSGDHSGLPQTQVGPGLRLAEQNDLAGVHPEVLHHVVNRIEHCHVVALNLPRRDQHGIVDATDNRIRFAYDEPKLIDQFTATDRAAAVELLLT